MPSLACVTSLFPQSCHRNGLTPGARLWLYLQQSPGYCLGKGPPPLFTAALYWSPLVAVKMNVMRFSAAPLTREVGGYKWKSPSGLQFSPWPLPGTRAWSTPPACGAVSAETSPPPPQLRSSMTFQWSDSSLKPKIIEWLTLLILTKSNQTRMCWSESNPHPVLQKRINSSESMCFSPKHKLSVQGGTHQHISHKYEVIYSQHLLALGSASTPG